jgi:subtilisin family serine protease
MKNNTRTPLVSLVDRLDANGFLCLGIHGHGQRTCTARESEHKHENKESSAARYTRDLTELARQGKLEASKGHEAAVRRVLQVFSSAKQNNPVLIGEDASNSKAVVEALAKRIATARVPENFRHARVYSLNLDALMANVKSTQELEGRLQSVLAEASSDQGNSILFVDTLYQFVGKNAEQTISQTLTDAASSGKVRLIGATSRGAYDQYIASDAMIAGLFQQVNLDELKSSETSAKEDGSNDDNGFRGEKISPDLRGSAAKGRVNVILQVDDVRSANLNDLFARYGVKVTARMARLGTVKAEMPVKALEELAASREVRHMSSDRQVKALGHVTATTGADAVRTQTTHTLLGGTTTYQLNGSGVGIAILDSGIDTDHESFLALDNSSRIVYSQDFTGEGRVDDPYGHGTHVAATAAGNGRIANARYTGIASNADIINLRVLNSTGEGSVSGLLSALEWVMDNHTTYNIRVVNMSLECRLSTPTAMTPSVAPFATWLTPAWWLWSPQETMAKTVTVRKYTARFTHQASSPPLSRWVRVTLSERIHEQTMPSPPTALVVPRAGSGWMKTA